MTPHERAIKTAEKITQWFWARTMTNATNCDAGEKYAAEQIEQAIIADRETCAGMVEQCFCDHRNSSLQNCVSCDLAAQIRTRSNQPEEKQSLTPFDPSCSTCVREAKEEAEAEENAKKKCGKDAYGQYGKYPCALSAGHDGQCKYQGQIKTVSIKTHENLDAYAYYVEKVNDWQANRIATLHEWQAQDQKTIQSLNASNNALSEKIAQLEKEKHALTQEISRSHFRGCHCEYCEYLRSRSTNRKA